MLIRAVGTECCEERTGQHASVHAPHAVRDRRNTVQLGPDADGFRQPRKHVVEPNPWRAVEDDEALPAHGLVTLSLARYLRESPSLREIIAEQRLGVRVAPGDVLDVPSLYVGTGRATPPPLIVVHFPSFTDGRGFSMVRTLRQRGFAGEVRASGAILPDQYAFLLQCGADSVDIADADPAPWREAVRTLSLSYQHGYAPADAHSDGRSSGHGDAHDSKHAQPALPHNILQARLRHSQTTR